MEVDVTSASPLAAPAIGPPLGPPDAEAEAAGVSDLFGTPDVADWGAEEAVNEAAFVGAPGLGSNLEQEVGAATAGALLDGIEQQEVREALLPTFLRNVRERPETNQELAEMHRMKEAAQEHVRWRSCRVDAAGPAVQSVAGAMRALARDELLLQYDPARDLGLLRGTGAPGSARAAQADFLGKRTSAP